MGWSVDPSPIRGWARLLTNARAMAAGALVASPGAAGGLLSARSGRALGPSISGHLALCPALEIGEIGEVNNGPGCRDPVLARRFPNEASINAQSCFPGR